MNGALVVLAAQRPACGFAGQWAGRKGMRIGSEFRVLALYEFRFAPDGSYSFAVGDQTGTAASHAGTFTVAAATDQGGRRYPCLLTLQPSRNTVRQDPSRHPGGLPDGFEALSAGAPATFRVKESGSGEALLIDVRVAGNDLLNDIGSFRLTRTP
jgi:hypothetical protein